LPFRNKNVSQQTKNKMKTYTLIDSLNSRTVSRHKSVLDAVKALERQTADKGEDDLIYYRICDENGVEVDDHQIAFAEMQIQTNQ
jgi:hypothetical protein